MHTTDRPAFIRLAEALFAAFEHVIGFEGEDDLPTPKQLYFIHRRLRNAARAAELEAKRTLQPGAFAPGEQPREPDRFDIHANKVLFAVLCLLTCQHGSAATEESLAEMIHVKHNFAQKYREQCVTDPDASLEMRDHLKRELAKRFVPREQSEGPGRGPLVPETGETWERAL
jgi:hypothetical protein